MPVSRLNIALERSELVLPQTGEIAVFRAQTDFNYDVLPANRRRFFNSFKPQHDGLQVQGPAAPDVPKEGQFGASLVHITRSKQETLGLIAKALLATEAGGLVIVDGNRTDGIDSIHKHCKSHLPPDGSLAKHHGRIFWIRRPVVLPDPVLAWRDDLNLARNKDGFFSAPGMFSPARADPGSLLLAAHFDTRIAGDVADLGAGWGWLSAAALKTAPDIRRIDLFEAEKTALEAARQNIADPRATFHWADVVQMDTDPRYDAILCNPPFHQGRAATPSLGLSFIETAARLLKPKGTLWLVANRQLPYEATLDARFAHIQTLEETHHFKAILAARPKSSRPHQSANSAAPAQTGPRRKRR